MRLFPSRPLAWALWLSVAANAIVFYLNGIFFLVQCSPTAYSWNKSIPGGKCWSPAFLVDWGYVTGSEFSHCFSSLKLFLNSCAGIGAVTDFAYAVLPWFYIVRLQMSTRRKIAVGLALSAGLLPFVCSILKIYYTSTLGADTDPTCTPQPSVHC